MLKFIVILSSVDWITKEEGVSSYYTSLLLEMAESAMILEKKKQAKAAALNNKHVRCLDSFVSKWSGPRLLFIHLALTSWYGDF